MERASEHAKDLKAEIKAFLETDPYELVHEFDPDAFPDGPPGTLRRRGIHLYRVNAAPVPDRISILAGDVLKDLRSALDYVAWQLALAVSDDPPATTAFPIFASEKAYKRDRKRYIGGIDQAIHADFEAVQPYHAGDEATKHPLWVLHRMANDDKHRVPHIVASLPTGIGFERPPGLDLFVQVKIGPVDEGEDPVATAGIIRGAPADKEPNLLATFDVAFGKDTPAVEITVFGEIDRIGREVDAVISRFLPNF
jgi:hypothetical protein